MLRLTPTTPADRAARFDPMVRLVAISLVLFAGWSLAGHAHAQTPETGGSGEAPNEPIEEPNSGDGDPGAPGSDGDATGDPTDPTTPATAAPTGMPRSICHGRVIRSVTIDGVRRVDPDDVLGEMRLRQGAVCSDDDVARDARTLWNQDLFDDIVIEARPSGDGIAIIVTLTERPVVASIVFEGNDEVSEEDLDEEVTLTEGGIVSIPDIREQLQKIRDKYAEEGFFLARVEYELRARDTDNNEVDVVFKITEGIETVVRSVRFTGNEHIDGDDLRGVMEIHETSIISFLTSNDSFQQSSFDDDMTRLQAYYYDQGYLGMQVGRPRVELSPDREYVDITVPVTEGPRFRIGELSVSEVDVDGNEVETLVPRAELLEGLGVESGDWFNRTSLVEALQGLTRQYRDEGYASAELTPETEVDTARRIVDLQISIQRGPIAYIERIEIHGNTKTRDRVIRREILLFEGMRYNQTLLERSRINIMALGYFERADVSEEAGSRPGFIVLNVEVAERPTGTFQVGAGFSSLEQFILTAQIDQQNLFGRGHALSLQLQLSGIRQLAQLSFVEPWFLGTMWSLQTDVARTTRQTSVFARTSTSAGVTFGHPIWDRRLRFNVGYRAEEVSIGASTGGFGGATGGQAFSAFRQSALANRFLSGFTSSVRFGLSWDSRNNRQRPTNGIFASYSAEMADPVFGSQNTYFRQNAFFRMYRRIWGPFIFRMNVEAGLITSRRERGVPIYERYYLGGIFNVRGFPYNALGPRGIIPSGINPDPELSLTGIPLGGNLQAFYQIEIQFNILESAGISGVVFTDGGNAWNLEANLGQVAGTSNPYTAVNVVDLTRIRQSAGFGFRWFSPMGPLRFEWGIPFARRPGEKPIDFQFTIGNAF
jgi:outer membrane protein insertion porin family